MRTTTSWLLAILILLPLGICQGQKPFIVMEWNVENLFDTRHDTGKDDLAFTPEGDQHWTPSRYWRKLNDIASVIAEAQCPAVIGLCEVENDSVLHDLCCRSALSAMGYRYIMTSSPDHRGIDVALLYRPHLFRPIDSLCVRVPSVEHHLAPTRDILYVTGVRMRSGYTADTLHVIVAHLPSKTGGTRGNRNRRLAAETLWDLTSRILAPTPASTTLVVMGDFNATSTDKIFRPVRDRLTLLTPHPSSLTPKPSSLTPQSPTGTYNYRGVWQNIDHILVHIPSSITSHPSSLIPQPHILATPRQLEADTTHGGTRPRRTFRGTFYHGGISDHLPLVWQMP